jgi:transposase InsO family protein
MASQTVDGPPVAAAFWVLCIRRRRLKTVKREEIHASAYRDFEDMKGRVQEFIDPYYNRCRLHSALRYSSPEEFEKRTQTRFEGNPAAAVMTFFGGS